MNLLMQPTSNSTNITEEIRFEFQQLGITRNTLMIRFLKEQKVIPLKEVVSYHLKWYLHDPTLPKKYWFLILTVELTNGRKESGPIAVAEFSHADDEREFRENIEGNIAEAIDLALSWDRDLGKLDGFERNGADLAPMAGLN